MCAHKTFFPRARNTTGVNFALAAGPGGVGTAAPTPAGVVGSLARAEARVHVASVKLARATGATGGAGYRCRGAMCRGAPVQGVMAYAFFS